MTAASASIIAPATAGAVFRRLTTSSVYPSGTVMTSVIEKPADG